MKVNCAQADLERALNIVSKAITPNSTLPVLNNILLTAKGKELHFAATNLEVAIQYFIPADVKNEGAITVPSKLLSSYISLLKDDKVDIGITTGNTVQITAKSSQTKIKGLDANEFPVIPSVEKENSIVLESAELEKAINQPAFAASLNTSRPVLSGVYFALNGDGVVVVATDSYRLAEKKIKTKERSEKEIECIVPARTAIELGKILSHEKSKTVELNISKNQVLFTVGDVRLMSRLIEGKFPPYEKIIPKDTKTKVLVSTEELINVVRRVSLFARENNNSIKISLTNDGKLTISTDETKVGEEKAEISGIINGENNKIALNAQYLIDVLNYVGSEKISFEIDDKLSPAVVRPEKGKDYVYIIMPLKI